MSGNEGALRSVVLATLLLTLGVSCTVSTIRANRTLSGWLECEHCEVLCDPCGARSELRAVVELGPSVVPALSETVVAGATPEALELRREIQRSRFDDLQKYAVDSGRELGFDDKEKFVNYYVTAYDSAVRIRAVEALLEIASPQALDALQRASSSVTEPRAVAEAINRALSRLRGKKDID